MFCTTSHVSRVEIPRLENVTLLGVVLELPDRERISGSAEISAMEAPAAITQRSLVGYDFDWISTRLFNHRLQTNPALSIGHPALPWLFQLAQILVA